MPIIKSSTDLRNNYNEISAVCHETYEPIFITRNGQGDLAVMSIEAYDELSGRKELYRLLEKGHKDVIEDRSEPLADAFADIRLRHKKSHGI